MNDMSCYLTGTKDRAAQKLAEYIQHEHRVKTPTQQCVLLDSSKTKPKNESKSPDTGSVEDAGSSDTSTS